MYILTFKVRELLIMYYVVLMFIDLFIDWGNPSRLTPEMILIDLGKPHKLPVGSRTSSLPLVTAVIVYKSLEFLYVYTRTVHLTTSELVIHWL